MGRAANAVPEQAVEHTLESEMAAEENLSNAGPSDADAAPVDTVREKVLVMPEQGLNLRAGPGTEFPVVTVLPEGTVLRVLHEFDEVDGWCPVILPELLQLGWVDRRYIEPANPEEG